MNTLSKIIPFVLILAACGGTESSSVPPQNTQKIPLSCSASARQGTYPYSIQGNNLVSAGSTLTREAAGDPARPVYGTWLVADQTQSGLHLHGTLKIEPNQVTVTSDCNYSDGRSTKAVAASAASVTDTDIIIKQTKDVTIPFQSSESEDEQAQTL